MKKLIYLIVLALILGLVLTGCSLLSNIGQAPATEQSGITYLTKGLPSSLVGWWRFNDNADDSSGYDNHGTVIGVDDYDFSPMGKALSFVDGVVGGNYVEISHPIAATTAITMEAWVWVGTPPPLATTAEVVCKWGGTGTGPGVIHFEILTNLKVRMCLRNDFNSTIVDFNSTEPLPVNQWVHVAEVWNGSKATIYFDSVAKGSQFNISNGPIKHSTSMKYWIGSQVGIDRYFRGLIDDVRIWDVALSEGQLGKVYDFKGFFPPVDMYELNVVKAGRAIPVKFNLNGDQGTDIFEYGYPKSITIKCNETDPDITLDEDITVTAGMSSLFYDTEASQYIYVWKTEKSWAETSSRCRQLVVKLNDGQSYYADFQFK